MGNSIYKPLQDPQREIRLLQLLPGYGAVPIQCILLHVNLNCLPQYEAISYTWGDPTVKNQIWIDGKLFDTMGNSRDALYELRLRHVSRVIWLDAICINQEDLTEKSAQVLLMKSIYEKASEVVIWLSPPRVDPDLAANSIWHLYKVLEAHLKSDRPVSSLRGTMITKLKSPGGIALLNVLCHPYFTRIWVFQEIVMARKVTIAYGHRKIDWIALVNLCHLPISMDFADLVMMKPGENIYDHNMFGLPHGFDIVKQMDNSRRERLLKIENGQAPSEIFKSMETNIIWCARRAATVPHDKIYALVGISSDIVEYVDLKPDYDADIRKVFTKWTESIISQKSSLQILSVAGIGSSRKLNDLPSFVPDLSSPPKATGFWHPDESKRYRAGTAYKTRIDLAGSGEGHVYMNAAAIGQVVELSPVFEERFAHPKNAADLHKWLERGEILAMDRAIDEPRLGAVHNAFWKTLIGNRDMADSEASPAFLFYYLLFRYALARELGLTKWQIRGFDRVTEEYDPAGDPKFFEYGSEHASVVFKHLLVRTATHRRFGIVNLGTPKPGTDWARSKQRGLLALFPPETKAGVEGAASSLMEGDWVYLFRGAQTPFVVRIDRSPEARKFSGSPTCYVVGECYVNGAMDGSLLEEMINARQCEDLFFR